MALKVLAKLPIRICLQKRFLLKDYFFLIEQKKQTQKIRHFFHSFHNETIASIFPEQTAQLKNTYEIVI